MNPRSLQLRLAWQVACMVVMVGVKTVVPTVVNTEKAWTLMSQGGRLKGGRTAEVLVVVAVVVAAMWRIAKAWTLMSQGGRLKGGRTAAWTMHLRCHGRNAHRGSTAVMAWSLYHSSGWRESAQRGRADVSWGG